MRTFHSTALTIVAAAALTLTSRLPDGLTAQTRGGGGGGMSTSRVASPTVVASWSSQWNSDGATVTFIVLWRGSPGWFAKGPRGGGSGGGGGTSGPNGTYHAYQTITEGGRTFELAFDPGRKIVKILDQEVSLETVNVILVDDADRNAGPRIVGSRWVEPAPEGQLKGPDAIADAVKRTPSLFEYLQCDLELDDPLMKKMMPIICDQMRP